MMKNYIMIIFIMMLSLNLMGTIDQDYIIVRGIRIGEGDISIKEFDKDFKIISFYNDNKFYNNVSSKNPTFCEAIEFIAKDETDLILYDYNNWNCAHYAEMVHNNAEAKGIRCGFVTIEYENTRIGHAINVFNTTDRGMIFIDCTGKNRYHGYMMDKLVNVELNENFSGVYLDDCFTFDNNKKIVDVNIYF